jgi:hypothetical protein
MRQRMIRSPRRAADEQRAQGLGIDAETMPLRALSLAELLTHGEAEVARAYCSDLLRSLPMYDAAAGPEAIIVKLITRRSIIQFTRR